MVKLGSEMTTSQDSTALNEKTLLKYMYTSESYGKVISIIANRTGCKIVESVSYEFSYILEILNSCYVHTIEDLDRLIEGYYKDLIELGVKLGLNVHPDFEKSISPFSVLHNVVTILLIDHNDWHVEVFGGDSFNDHMAKHLLKQIRSKEQKNN